MNKILLRLKPIALKLHKIQKVKCKKISNRKREQNTADYYN